MFLQFCGLTLIMSFYTTFFIFFSYLVFQGLTLSFPPSLCISSTVSSSSIFSHPHSLHTYSVYWSLSPTYPSYCCYTRPGFYSHTILCWSITSCTLSHFLTHFLSFTIPSFLNSPHLPPLIFFFLIIIILPLLLILLLCLHHTLSCPSTIILLLLCSSPSLSLIFLRLLSPFPLPDATLYSSKTKDRERKVMCVYVGVHLHITPPHASCFSQDIIEKECFQKRDFHPFSRSLRSKQSDE